MPEVLMPPISMGILSGFSKLTAFRTLCLEFIARSKATKQSQRFELHFVIPVFYPHLPLTSRIFIFLIFQCYIMTVDYELN